MTSLPKSALLLKTHRESKANPRAFDGRMVPRPGHPRDCQRQSQGSPYFQMTDVTRITGAIQSSGPAYCSQVISGNPVPTAISDQGPQSTQSNVVRAAYNPSSGCSTRRTGLAAAPQ